MKNIILTIVTVFCITTIHAQNIYFIKSYGNSGYDFGRDIKQDLDTGYIATGSSSSFTSGTADAFLLKVDSLGNFKWSYNYGGQETDWGESVVVTLDSSYAIGGYTNSFGAGGFDFYLVRANRDGTPLWQKTYGGTDWDRAHSLIQLPDSGFVLAGETFSYGNGNSDIYIVRTDKNGDTLWTKTYGGAENDYANAVILDGDSLVVVGGTESFGAGMTDGIILKYHINGNLGWTKVVGMDKEDYFTSISKSLISNIYSIGGSRNYDHFQNCDCGQDFWLYQITENGNVIIDTSRSGNDQIGTEEINDILMIDNNNIIYGGNTTSWGYISFGKTEAFLGKFLNNFYSPNYVKNFGFEGDDDIRAIDICYDGGIIGIGKLDYNSSGGSNVMIFKVDKTNSQGGFAIQLDLEPVEQITLNIENNSTINQFKIKTFPNPFFDKVYFEGISANNNVQIYDIFGNIVFKKNNINNYIDLDFLTKGVYLIKINNDGYVYQTKIIKN